MNEHVRINWNNIAHIHNENVAFELNDSDCDTKVMLITFSCFFFFFRCTSINYLFNNVISVCSVTTSLITKPTIPTIYVSFYCFWYQNIFIWIWLIFLIERLLNYIILSTAGALYCGICERNKSTVAPSGGTLRHDWWTPDLRIYRLSPIWRMPR